MCHGAFCSNKILRWCVSMKEISSTRQLYTVFPFVCTRDECIFRTRVNWFETKLCEFSWLLTKWNSHSARGHKWRRRKEVTPAGLASSIISSSSRNKVNKEMLFWSYIAAVETRAHIYVQATNEEKAIVIDDEIWWTKGEHNSSSNCLWVITYRFHHPMRL